MALGDRSAEVQTSKQKGIALLLEAVKLASSSNRRGSNKGVRDGTGTAHRVELARVLAVEGNVSDERTLTAAILGTVYPDQSVKAIERGFGRKIGAIVA